MFKTMEECFDWLYEPREFKAKFDLGRMELAMRAFNNPIDYKCIHIGGTNGKGSTLSYMKHALIKAGYKVGTFISPYIINFNERMTIDHEYIKDEEFIYYMNQMYYTLTLERITLTYFEILTIVAFLYFRDQEVDYALMEVGLGGRLDSTNVMPEKEVAVISNVGHDHMDVLGDDIFGIAKEKLGIVHDALITSIQPEFRELVSSYTSQRHAFLEYVDAPKDVECTKQYTKFKYKQFDLTLSMLGAHQATNASLAIEALLYLRAHKGLKITDEQIKQGLERTFWPGRLERVRKNIYVDGAHNEEGIQSLVDFLKTIEEPKTIVFTCLKDKPYELMIPMLDEVADELIITEFVYERAIDGRILYELSTNKNKKFEKNYEDTYSKVGSQMTIYCGSLYFISKIRKDLLE